MMSESQDILNCIWFFNCDYVFCQCDKTKDVLYMIILSIEYTHWWWCERIQNRHECSDWVSDLEGGYIIMAGSVLQRTTDTMTEDTPSLSVNCYNGADIHLYTPPPPSLWICWYSANCMRNESITFPHLKLFPLGQRFQSLEDWWRPW